MWTAPGLKPAVLALGVMLSSAALASDERPDDLVCFTPREARHIASREHLADFATIRRSVERSTGSEVLNVRLCRRNNRLVYRLTMLRRGGQVMTTLVDAVDGIVGPVLRAPSPRIDRNLTLTPPPQS